MFARPQKHEHRYDHGCPGGPRCRVVLEPVCLQESVDTCHPSLLVVSFSLKCTDLDDKLYGQMPHTGLSPPSPFFFKGFLNQVCVYTGLFMYTCVCVYACAFVGTCVHVFVCTYVHVCVCACTHVWGGVWVSHKHLWQSG